MADAPHFLNGFESFGANCEFGFVQERCAVDNASLFRWAEIRTIRSLIDVLNAEFSNIYAFENLKPFNAGMVIDASLNIAWHSVIKSQLIDDGQAPTPSNFKYVETEGERLRLWNHEIGKVKLLTERTKTGLSHGGRIYVYKPLASNSITTQDLSDLVSAIKNYNVRNTLLVVETSTQPEEIGRACVISPGLIRGKIDRFAPGRNARDVSLDAWLRVCESACSVLGVERLASETPHS